jgi:uncharacterized tellurite resistance protein B-like protein
MSGFLDSLRKKVTSTVFKDTADQPNTYDIDDRIALGVLLWEIAGEDGKILPQEETALKDILSRRIKASMQDIEVVMASIKAAAKERIDLYTFTSQIEKGLSYEVKLEVVGDLFRLACCDNDLDDAEYELIRKICGLLNVSHKDFIDIKIKVKKESGLDTCCE